MSLLGQKLHRLGEAAGVTGLGADLDSKLKLARCFARLGQTVTDSTEIDLVISSNGLELPCRIRRSDVFTLIELFHEGQYRHEVRPLDAPIIVDAGANVGLATLWLLGLYPDAEIHAFEPSSDNFRLLAHNAESRLRVHAYQAALGAENGEILLSLADHGAMHSTMPGVEAEGTGSEPVRCETLAGFMERADLSVIDILKLDVEGAELDVLVGLGDRLGDVDRILGEVHERVVDVDAFYAHLDGADFEVTRSEFEHGAQDGVHGFEAVRRR